jgi:hypothetical protein
MAVMTAALESMIVESQSLLARTAIELAERHPFNHGIEGEPWCLRCWAPWPCGPAQHAREVCNAAGVTMPTKAGRSGARPNRSMSTSTDRFVPMADPLPGVVVSIGGGARAAY